MAHDEKSGDTVDTLLAMMQAPSLCPDCGAPSKGGTRCASCVEAYTERHAHEASAAARAKCVREFVNSVDEDLRWSSFDSSLLHDRVHVAEPDRAITLVRDIVEARRTEGAALVLVLRGGAALGKTSLAVAAARGMAELGRSALFARAHDLAVEGRATPYGHRCALIESAKRVDVLILDDLGQEPAELFEHVKQVIHVRAWKRTLLVTTGLTREQMESRYDEGTYRRLTEGPRSIVLHLRTGTRVRA